MRGIASMLGEFTKLRRFSENFVQSATMPDADQPPFRAPRQAPYWVRALEVIDGLLRETPTLTEQLQEIVSDALVGQDTSPLSVEQWMRALFVQQMSGRGDECISFHLNDSPALRGFCGIVEQTDIPHERVVAILRRMDEATWQALAAKLQPLMGRAWKKRYRARVGW